MTDREHELEQRLARAEEAIARLTARLEAENGGTVVQAPFQIVDADGKVLLDVAARPNDTGLRLFNTNGDVAAALGVDGTRCGCLAIRNEAGKLVGCLSVEMAGARPLLIGSNHDGGLAMGTDDIDGGWFHVSNTTGNFCVTLGADPHGGFLDIINNASDNAVVTLTATSEGGNIEVVNNEGNCLFDAAEAPKAKASVSGNTEEKR
jgi:hypothetical protein